MLLHLDTEDNWKRWKGEKKALEHHGGVKQRVSLYNGTPFAVVQVERLNPSDATQKAVWVEKANLWGVIRFS